MGIGAQRKAWNEAMGLNNKSSTQRRSGRQKKQSRREKARKSIINGDSSSALEAKEYQNAVHIDALEGISGDLDNEFGDEQDEYDELEELEGNKAGGARKRGRKKAKISNGMDGTSAINSSSAKKKRNSICNENQLKPRTLASFLIEDTGRPDGITKKYLDAEARPSSTYNHPPRKFCPVTGLLGKYTDVKTGIPFANLKALEQIQERVPPWMNLGGNATYSETITSLRNED